MNYEQQPIRLPAPARVVSGLAKGVAGTVIAVEGDTVTLRVGGGLLLAVHRRDVEQHDGEPVEDSVPPAQPAPMTAEQMEAIGKAEFLTDETLDAICREHVTKPVDDADMACKMVVLSLVADLRNCRGDRDSLLAEAQRLRDALAGAASIANLGQMDLHEARKDQQRLQAENDRLRDKLQQIDGQRQDAVQECERLRREFGGLQVEAPPALEAGNVVWNKAYTAYGLGRILAISKSGKSAKVDFGYFGDWDRAKIGLKPWPAYYPIRNLVKVEDES